MQPLHPEPSRTPDRSLFSSWRSLCLALLMLPSLLVTPSVVAMPPINPWPHCIAVDVNGDGQLDRSDLYYMADVWLSNDPAGDLSGDGIVDTIDLRILADCSPEIAAELGGDIGRFPDLGRG